MKNEVERTDIPLVQIVDRLLEKGVVVAGGATIAVAGVDLIELRLNVLLAATDTFAQSLLDIGDRAEFVVTLAWRASRPVPETGQEYMDAKRAERQEAERIVDRFIAELGIERALIRERICPRPGVAATVAVMSTLDKELDLRRRVDMFERNANEVTTEVSGPVAPRSSTS